MKVIIDRFEGKFAVIELEDGSFANMPKVLVPIAAKEGSVLLIEIDQEETQKRKAIIEILRS